MTSVSDRLFWIRAYIESADMDEVNRDVLRRQVVLLTVEITEETEELKKKIDWIMKHGHYN